MNTISPYLITKLYNWTNNDLNIIFHHCFKFNPEKSRYEGPSNTFASAIAALMDTWGSIMRDQFGDPNHEQAATKKNVEHVLKLLYMRDPKNYEVFDKSTNKIYSNAVELFRHNLIHNFGKKPKGKAFDLNIDCLGMVMNLQKSNGRWHINCKKLYGDFLNLLRIELPNLIKK
jgi:hypothetical protein